MEAIVFSEFDNILGRKISFQEPPDAISGELFATISDYLITDEELCGKLINLTAFDRQFVSCAIRLENAKYERNCLIFNVAIVLHPSTESYPYKAIVRKLAALLEILEIESEFLFNPSKKCQLERILPQVFIGLRNSGECAVFVDAANTINLKLFPKVSSPDPVLDHQVPVRLCDFSELVQTQWDLTLREILPFVDGINYVKRISVLANVELDLVRQCIRQLLYYDIVCMIDIFQYSNVYKVTAAVNRLARDKQMQKACIANVVRASASATVNQSTILHTILSLYCMVSRGKRVRELCETNTAFKTIIDIRRFVTFGLVNKIISRVHAYPMLLSDSAGRTHRFENRSVRTLGRRMSPSALLQNLNALLDGNHSFDEICCSLDLSLSEVDALVARNRHCITIVR